MIRTVNELFEFFDQCKIDNNMCTYRNYRKRQTKSNQIRIKYFTKEFKANIAKHIPVSKKQKFLKVACRNKILLNIFAYRNAYLNIKNIKIIDQGLNPRSVYFNILNNKSSYKKVYDMLSDHNSKKTFIYILMYRLTRDFAYIIGCYDEGKQYCDKKMQLGNKEVIVDCGAYIGDTLQEFIKSGIIPKKYFLFELEEKNYEIMIDNCNKIKKLYQFEIEYFRKGVFRDERTIYFEENKDSSKIVDYVTNKKIEVVALDHLIKEPVTYIKMDIEGSEIDALIGCQELIRKYKPRLAICIYHKQSDFYKIPILIKQICPEYRNFYIRHYSYSRIETVLYVTV